MNPRKELLWGLWVEYEALEYSPNLHSQALRPTKPHVPLQAALDQLFAELVDPLNKGQVLWCRANACFLPRACSGCWSLVLSTFKAALQTELVDSRRAVRA